MNDTAIAKTPDPKAPIKLGVTKAALTKLKAKYKKVPDASTPEGYEFILNAKRELQPLRTAVEKEATVQKATAQTHINNINSVKNTIVETIKAIEAPLYTERKRVDDLKAEQDRVAAEKEERRVTEIEAKVDEIQELTEGLLNASLEVLEERLAAANAITITDEVYMEFTEAASLVLGQAKAQLTNAVASAKALAAQQKEIDAQQDGLKVEQKKRDLQDSINRIRMAPIDVMGESVDVMTAAIGKLGGIDVEEYGNLKIEAATAIGEAREKIEGMMAQQKALDDQQADIDRQKKEQDDKAADDLRLEAEETARKEQEQKDADEAEALAARMPDDVKLREYGKALEAVVVPFIDDTYMLTIQSRAVTMVEDIAKFINDNTQDPA